MAKRQLKPNNFELFRIEDTDSINALAGKFEFHANRIEDEETLFNSALEQALNEETALYVLINNKSQSCMGMLSVCFWTIESSTMLYVSLICVNRGYRNKKYMLGGKVQKVSTYLLKDICINILCNIDIQVPLKTIFLQPINNKVATAYKNISKY
ncbi:MAG: hypothetical protein RL154_1033 [Pseudomonadota bacterium]|jgi:hypothetical protein